MSRFTDFLLGKFNKVHPEVLDDDLGPKFEAWIESLDHSDLIDYADEYGEEIRTEEFLNS